MKYDCLVGYKFGVVWEGEDGVEEYTIVSSNANKSRHEVNMNVPFVESLYGKNRGDICTSNGENFRIEYIINPSFDLVIKQRNITKLYHFSALENVDNIMENGILSVEMLEKIKN